MIVWRSSRQTVSTLSTAEAELNAATLAWQIVEGVRLLISDLGVQLDSVKLLLDNKAALTIAQCGATWRTMYFAVRGARLHEEHAAGRASLEYCKTGDMLADALTKLAPAPVIAILHSAMHGELPIPSTPTVSSALVDGSCEQIDSQSHVSKRFVKKKKIYTYGGLLLGFCVVCLCYQL